MREIVVISGKGGAGKTTIMAAFSHLAGEAVLCDLDVDAPDLHLLLNPKIQEENAFRSGHEAVINPEKCVMCGTCRNMCRFDAIELSLIGYSIKPFHCEGCKVCVEFCPSEAIDFPEKHCGNWYVSDTRFSPMVHAQLFPGEENSGRLVTLLKQRAWQMAETAGIDLVLCDGAPGIGCPVISSLAGTDVAIVVTEPTPSGIHDLERVADLCVGFRTKVAVLINKWDINPPLAESIESYCREKGFSLIGRLAHDPGVVNAMIQRQVLTEYDPSGLGSVLHGAWEKVLGLLEDDKATS
ncbi:MAG: (4Fe-4S)-binding protein [Desulfovibrio sp.]|nr:(4Fe-4S)-binding protein [Desulfovibrio sp.]MBC18249.1 (4Fe-4S)-binding protein [Desulfovibrio sp.]|tara:strand:+ start:363 stop:1250 length:888 start_codon:yes stop_codon:yes gene_type:complete